MICAGRRLFARMLGRRSAAAGGLLRCEGGGDLEGAVLMLPAGWDEWYADGTYEPQIAAALKRLVRAGDVCVDAGAHVGYFTLLLAKLSAPDGRVFSFEPNPENASIVRANVEANGLAERVVVEEAAVAEDDGMIELHATPSGGSSEWSTSAEFAARTGTSKHPSVSVRSLRLDRFLDSLNRLDVIKMDIEGAEGVVLPLLQPQLERFSPTIVLEFHGEVGWPAIGALHAAGYLLESLEGSPLPILESTAEVPYQLVARPPTPGTPHQ